MKRLTNYTAYIATELVRGVRGNLGFSFIFLFAKFTAPIMREGNLISNSKDGQRTYRHEEEIPETNYGLNSFSFSFIFWTCSSAGQSRRLITVSSRVRIPAGPPCKVSLNSADKGLAFYTYP